MTSVLPTASGSNEVIVWSAFTSPVVEQCNESSFSTVPQGLKNIRLLKKIAVTCSMYSFQSFELFANSNA